MILKKEEVVSETGCVGPQEVNADVRTDQTQGQLQGRELRIPTSPTVNEDKRQDA